MPHKSGYRAGIPQKEPYTKWDTDKDEIEVDYKQMDDSSPPSLLSGFKGVVLKVLLLFTVFLVGIIIGYIIRRSVHHTIPNPNKCDSSQSATQQGYSEDFARSISDSISTQQLQEFLKAYSKDFHITASHNNVQLCKSLQTQMESYGFKVRTATYNVLISYTKWDSDTASSVSLLDANGTVMYETKYRGPTDPSNMYHPEIRRPFLAFSPNATVQGDIVYANYGDEDDFEELRQKNVSCKGNIVMMRYGEIYRGLKVENAEKSGAAGVLLYSDPSDVTGQYMTRVDVYPHTWFLPNWTVQSGSILPVMEGDPLTPDLPSLHGMYRISQQQARLPHIPVLPVSYGDAQQLMKNMDGALGSSTFRGSLSHPNVTYRLGPGYDQHRKNWRLSLDVHMDTDRRDITNIIAVLKGSVEPDRYVIVGCHYDAWGFGAVDPGSGTAILMELARVFGQKYQQGWKPRRTLMFVHWDAEEQGLMGSYEWLQENERELSERTVVYVNLDGPIKGNYSLDVQANPLLHDLLYNTANKYQTPLDTGQTMYDQWKKNCPHNCLHPAGPGSDHAPFVFMLGVAAMWPMYTFNPEEHSFVSYPAYHTVLDNYDYIKTFIDPEFKSHTALARYVGHMLYELTDRPKLPFNVQLLKKLLDNEYNQLKPCCSQHRLLEPLASAVDNFSLAAEQFQDRFDQLPLDDDLAVRRYNDRLLRVSQAFIYPPGLPTRPLHRNLLFAQSSVGSQSGKVFAGIHDAYYEWQVSSDKDSSWAQLHKQISIATVAVRSATRTLRDVDAF